MRLATEGLFISMLRLANQIETFSDAELRCANNSELHRGEGWR